MDIPGSSQDVYSIQAFRAVHLCKHLVHDTICYTGTVVTSTNETIELAIYMIL